MSFRPRLLRHAFALALIALSCSDDPPKKGQLMIAIQTDMSIPKDVDHIRVRVTNIQGVERYDLSHAISHEDGMIGSKLPATVAIVEGEEQSSTVNIQVIAEHKQEPRTLREATVQVPPDRIAVLHLPIQWLCSDRVTGSRDELKSDCPADETCIAGDCVPKAIDAAKLPTYTDMQVFGGGTATGGGQCFDTARCFARSQAIRPVTNSDGTCTVTWPSNDLKLNLGLRLPKDGDGICEGDDCFVALEGRSDNGWKVLEGAPTDTGDAGINRPDGGTAGSSSGFGGSSSGFGGSAGVSSGFGGTAGSGQGEDCVPSLCSDAGGMPCCVDRFTCGFMVADSCQLPSDTAQNRTQQSSDEASQQIRIKLPVAVCRKLEQNPEMQLRATTSCASVKNDSTPTCGPWSAVGVARSTAPCDLACDKLTLAGAVCPAETDSAAKDPQTCRISCDALPVTAPDPCGSAYQSYVNCVATATHTCGESGLVSEPDCDALAQTALQSCRDAGAGGTGGDVDSGPEGTGGAGGSAGRATGGAGGSAGSAIGGTGGSIGAGGAPPQDASGGRAGAGAGGAAPGGTGGASAGGAAPDGGG